MERSVVTLSLCDVIDGGVSFVIFSRSRTSAVILKAEVNDCAAKIEYVCYLQLCCCLSYIHEVRKRKKGNVNNDAQVETPDRQTGYTEIKKKTVLRYLLVFTKIQMYKDTTEVPEMVGNKQNMDTFT